MIDKANALQLVVGRFSAKGIDQQDGQGHASRQEIGGEGVGHSGLQNGRDQLCALCLGADGVLSAPHKDRTRQIERNKENLGGQGGSSAPSPPEIAPDRPALDLKFFISGHREIPLSSAGRWSRPADTR